jgi:hypothetical protein
MEYGALLEKLALRRVFRIPPNWVENVQIKLRAEIQGTHDEVE